MSNAVTKENPCLSVNEKSIHKSARKPRMTKAEEAVYYALLIEDIRINGPRQPIELARKYGISEKKASEFVAKGILKGDINPETLDYVVTGIWGIKAFIQKMMGLDDKALLKIEGDENALLITPLK